MITKVEQSELIEELTVKLQETEIKLAATSVSNRHEAAEAVVTSHVVGSMSLGLLPLPLLDIAALAGAQLNMLRSLSKHYNINFDEKIAKSALNSLTIGSLPVLSTIGLSSFAKIIPGIGTILGGVSVSVLSGAVVYASGQVFIRHFEAGGTLDDFNSKKWLSYFKEQFEEGKIFIKDQYKNSKISVNKGFKSSKSYLKGIKSKFTKVKESDSSEINNEKTTETESKNSKAA